MLLPEKFLSLRYKLNYLLYAKQKGVLVLLYHSISDPTNDPHKICVSPDNFDKHLGELKKHFRFITPDNLYTSLTKGKIPPRSALITFDDGYENNFTTAARILRKHQIPALFFVSTYSVLSREPFWWDKLSGQEVTQFRQSQNPYLSLSSRRAIVTNLPAKISSLIKISKEKNFFIGAHTHYHPSLASLSKNEQTEQILFSKTLLKHWLKKEIKYFAYPFGGLDDFNSSSENIVRQNFRMGFTTLPFLANSSLFPARIPRFNVTDISSSALMKELAIRFPQFPRE